MKKFICQVILGLAFIYGCEHNPAQGIKLVSKEEFIDMVDTISIAINPDLLGKYGRFHISEDNYLVGYNRFFHRIDVFSLDKRSFSHSIQLDYKGPNGISSCIYMLKIKDKYIVKSGYFYNSVSTDGTIISKKGIKT